MAAPLIGNSVRRGVLMTGASKLKANPLRAALVGVLCATSGGLNRVAIAQEPFPKGNIEITVLFPAGSSADVSARLLAEGMGKQLGTTVIVVNRPGAGGAIGYRYAARQKPDGYSL